MSFIRCKYRHSRDLLRICRLAVLHIRKAHELKLAAAELICILHEICRGHNGSGNFAVGKLSCRLSARGSEAPVICSFRKDLINILAIIAVGIVGAYAVKPLAELRNGITEKQRVIRYREKALGGAFIMEFITKASMRTIIKETKQIKSKKS